MPLQPVPPLLDSAVRVVIDALVSGVEIILGQHLVGIYLDGSLACGDFDQDSDIDFVVVTDVEISPAEFYRLRAMHERIAHLDSPFAVELEGTYISKAALKRYDPNQSTHPHIQRGSEEHLEIVQHDDDWSVHLDILRERGIALRGPAPHTLVDSVSPNALRRAMLKRLNGWAGHILDNPTIIQTRGYQSYTVLSLCRILYTLELGAVVSKRIAARWAQTTLDQKWTPLIERTWDSRHHPHMAALEEDISETLGLIRFALEHSTGFQIPNE